MFIKHQRERGLAAYSDCVQQMLLGNKIPSSVHFLIDGIYCAPDTAGTKSVDFPVLRQSITSTSTGPPRSVSSALLNSKAFGKGQTD